MRTDRGNCTPSIRFTNPLGQANLTPIMTILYEPDENRFRMPTDAGDAVVDFFWQGGVMVLPHAEVPLALRGTGAGARLANGVFAQIEEMGVKARPTCPFLVRVARSDPRWQKLFGL